VIDCAGSGGAGPGPRGGHHQGEERHGAGPGQAAGLPRHCTRYDKRGIGFLIFSTVLQLRTAAFFGIKTNLAPPPKKIDAEFFPLPGYDNIYFWNTLFAFIFAPF
jgi:hypothetical protein